MNRSTSIKILMLTSSYPRTKEDNAGIFLSHLAKNLSKRGIDVHVLAPSDPNTKGGTCVEDNVTVHRFQYFPARLQQLAYHSGILPNLRRKPWLWIQVPFLLLSMTYSMLRLVQRERTHLIHAHWVLPQGLVALLAKFLFQIPVVSTAHGADAFALGGRLLRKLKRFVLRMSDAWTSNTHATAAAFGDAYSLPQPHIIPMGVDVDRFHRGRGAGLRAELPPGEFLVLFVGRLVEKKGVDHLLKALSLLRPEFRCETTLWVVGDGDHRRRLHQLAETLGISEKTRFWGAVNNDLLPDFYAAADLFVAPSIHAASGDTEGQGVVLLEAFATRSCVLATRVGGISEVVEDGYTGLLVEPSNPKQLASAMEKLLGDERLRARLGENAFSKVKEFYSWTKIAQNFEDLYRDTISKKGQSPSSPIF